ncbi:UDP-N-acetylglucosamine 2-epimerase (non-hydrolyzing) [Streptomyces sp. R302]|uniref:non-hydrolyzing UDP-N-acetylglucosamine 2-epimerase n=1 Tax=unclassified Streptomyces TaxID=2593676 RepID=UPI00145D8494|nr:MULTISPECIES: UDP-N-acetylglucosamine 2-epimerase (non-hydrolyzing) [unclassified Streptomyces]NML49099.1 UDP-N-acetylglucosamine 2-epimerase (non-hydrolyzing) [Streptomyces sp. R301]NML77426.1 UDP-N-acetylglucosamine 2-epimerase (non-hydrolyzing) [Streptomyces sp. R302]
MHTLPARSVALVLGTRPELVKLAELIRILGPAARVVHTGQHYDEELSGGFLTELGLPEPEYLTGVGGRPRAVQVAAALGALDGLFATEPPLAVIVQGDTNAALAGALAANARDLPLVHVEAGLRSHDRAMPEEHNRVLIDRLADVLCAATPDNRALLLAEGLPEERIAVTGNPVVEAVRDHLPPAGERARLLAAHGLTADGYVLATVHRPENTDDREALRAVLTELAALADRLPVVLPLHPRTRARIDAAGLGGLLDAVTVLPPAGYGTFLALARHAAVLVSDSGGVQEETTVLGRPLIVVRRSTERPEALADFAELVAPGPRIGAAVRARLDEGPLGLRRLAALPSPYGDGTASQRIATLTAHLAKERAVPAASHAMAA